MAFKPIEILINAKDNASAVFGSLQTKVAAVGAAIATYFGINAFAGVVRGAADLETAMSRVQAATGATGDQMAALRKAAEDAGASTKFTSAEAAAALENLAKAGLDAGQAIDTLPAVLNTAQAADIGLAEASEMVTKAVMGMGLQFSEAGRVADVLALGANATNTSITGLSQALSYAAPVANSLGLSLETTAAIIGKFADAGIDASRAGTALNSILSQFSDPASAFRRELAAAGITTTDFEKALHQLAAAGPAGSKAILAVGQEAGPALRALLAQGMGALDELKAKLDNAAGSAAATAATMQNNLNGALSGLSSAWDTVKNALGTPVLPVLKDGVDQLAAAFRAAVADGTVQRFGESIATAFKTGIQFVKDFLSTVDFSAVLVRLQDFANSTNETLTKVGEYATNAGNTVKLAWGVMGTGVDTVMALIYKVAESFAGVTSNILSGMAMLYEGLSKITFGEISKKYKEVAEGIRQEAQATWAVSEAFAKKSEQSFQSAVKNAELAKEGFAGLSGATQEASTQATAGAAAFDDMGKRLEEVRQKSHDAGAAAEKKAQQDLAAKKAAEEHAAAIVKLGDDYRAAVAAGNWQRAAELQEKINQKLRETPAAGKDAARAAADTAADTAAAIESAFRALGVTSSAELAKTAAQAQSAYETIKASGTSTAQDIANAFRVAAERAIAANDGIAPAWVRSQAAVRGFRIEADDTGKSIVRSMEEAEGAVTNVGKAADNAGKGFQRLGKDAESAGGKIDGLREKARRLREENDRQNRGGNNQQGGGGGHGGGANPLSPSVNDPQKVLDYYKKYLPTTSEDFDKAVNKSRGEVSGNATLTQEYIDAQIAKRWGEQFIGDSDAMELFNAQIKLDAYRTNYGNVVRSQQSLNEQHALLQAVQRLEEKLRARQADGLNKRLTQADDDGTEPEPTTRRSRTTGGGGVQGGMQTGAVAGGTVVNLNYNGVQLGAVNTDASGRQALQKFMDALTNARGTSR